MSMQEKHFIKFSTTHILWNLLRVLELVLHGWVRGDSHSLFFFFFWCDIFLLFKYTRIPNPYYNSERIIQ